MWRQRQSVHTRLGYVRDSASPFSDDDCDPVPTNNLTTYYDAKTGVHRSIHVERTVHQTNPLQPNEQIEPLSDSLSSDGINWQPQQRYAIRKSEIYHVEYTQKNNIHLETVVSKPRKRRKHKRRQRSVSSSRDVKGKHETTGRRGRKHRHKKKHEPTSTKTTPKKGSGDFGLAEAIHRRRRSPEFGLAEAMSRRQQDRFNDRKRRHENVAQQPQKSSRRQKRDSSPPRKAHMDQVEDTK